MKKPTRQLWLTRFGVLVFFTALMVPLGWIAWGVASLYNEREALTEQTRQHGPLIQQAAIKRCRDRGGFAALGFAEVICLESSAVKWSEQVSW